MKRNQRRMSKSFSPCRLLLDDLRRLEEHLSLGGRTVRVQFDDHTFDSIDELAETAPKEVHNIQMDSNSDARHTSSLVLELSRSAARLWSLYPLDDDDESWTILTHVTDLMERRRNRLSVYAARAASFAILLTFLIVAGQFLGEVSALMLGLVIGVVTSFFVTDRIFPHSRIILVPRRTYETFWQRNSDKVLVSIMTFAATTPLSLAAGYFLGKPSSTTTTTRPAHTLGH